MRVMLVCALAGALLPSFCLAAPVFAPAPFAAPNPEPVKASFAYPARHDIDALQQHVIDAMHPGEAVSIMLREEAQPILLPPEATVPRDPTRHALCHAIASVATAYGLPFPFFANLIHQESTFRLHVVSRAGAQGIAQFMPRTAKAYGLYNPFDPVHALVVSGLFLSELLEQFGNVGLAAAAYNAGPGRVRNFVRKGGQLPQETQNYVRSITGRTVAQWRGVKSGAEFTLPAKADCPEPAPTEPMLIADAEFEHEAEDEVAVATAN